MPSSPRNIPVIIGVGDFVNRSKKVEDAIEPLQLMIAAIREALQDTGLPPSSLSELQSSIDSISVVRSWTWPLDYPNAIAEKLAFKPLHAEYPADNGGNQPAKLLDEAARRISLGENRVAVVTGAEALASCKSPLDIDEAVCSALLIYSPDHSDGVCCSQKDATARLDSSPGGGQIRFRAFDGRATGE
jgi:hypothetical protein